MSLPDKDLSNITSSQRSSCLIKINHHHNAKNIRDAEIYPETQSVMSQIIAVEQSNERQSY